MKNNKRRAEGSRNSGRKDQEKETPLIWTCGADRGEDYQSQLYMDMWREREAEGGRGRFG